MSPDADASLNRDYVTIDDVHSESTAIAGAAVFKVDANNKRKATATVTDLTGEGSDTDTSPRPRVRTTPYTQTPRGSYERSGGAMGCSAVAEHRVDDDLIEAEQGEEEVEAVFSGFSVREILSWNQTGPAPYANTGEESRLRGGGERGEGAQAAPSGDGRKGFHTFRLPVKMVYDKTLPLTLTQTQSTGVRKAVFVYQTHDPVMRLMKDICELVTLIRTVARTNPLSCLSRL